MPKGRCSLLARGPSAYASLRVDSSCAWLKLGGLTLPGGLLTVCAIATGRGKGLLRGDEKSAQGGERTRKKTKSPTGNCHRAPALRLKPVLNIFGRFLRQSKGHTETQRSLSSDSSDLENPLQGRCSRVFRGPSADACPRVNLDLTSLKLGGEPSRGVS